MRGSGLTYSNFIIVGSLATCISYRYIISGNVLDGFFYGIFTRRNVREFLGIGVVSVIGKVCDGIFFLLIR